MSRYVVTELEGFLTRTGDGRMRASAPFGLSCHVIDKLWNHRLVATYRTENGSRRLSHASKLGTVRAQAREHAERLNAAHSRDAVSPHSERTA